MIKKIVEIMNSRLLTPVIYFLDDDVPSVIGFFDGSTQMNYLYDTQVMIERAIGKEINLCDIRDFCEADRMEIVKTAELIYSETPLVRTMFEAAMAEDYTISESKKQDIIQRNINDGTVYLS